MESWKGASNNTKVVFSRVQIVQIIVMEKAAHRVDRFKSEKIGLNWNRLTSCESVIDYNSVFSEPSN